MIITELTQTFLDNPKYLDSNYMSNPRLAKKFKTTIEKVKLSKEHAKSLLSAKSYKEATKKVTLSPKPLSQKEIDGISGADNVTSFVSGVWKKSKNGGSEWDYSINVKNTIQDFYTRDELKEKMKELLPDLEPFSLPRIGTLKNKTLVVYLSDDHVGMLLNNSIFNKSNDLKTYMTRLHDLFSEIDSHDTYEEVIIISLGDQLDGWNGQTTRGGHSLNSRSNKDQFDDYIFARKTFYDSLFRSGISKKFSIYEINNSNHSGLGMSYMANAWLQLYIETRYPEVKYHNTTNFYELIKLSTGHCIIALHGKDEKNQKFGFPLNIDSKTEVFFTDLMLELGINPKKTNVTIVKGDLHRYNENEAKNFRYLTIPSIANGSEWQECNFGTSKPGIVMEVFTENSQEPWKKVLRF